MKLTQALWRKRRMITKPQSYLRNMMWNNSWYKQQERPIQNYKIKETLEERNIVIHQIDDIISPILPPKEHVEIDTVPISSEALLRDETHPYWKDEPAYSYGNRSWQPRDNQLLHAQAVTNSLGIDSLPSELLRNFENTKVSSETEDRVEKLIISCYVGDATQKLLPKNWKVPYIGWHPVESTMVPRKQYDTEAFSWGRNMPREYGIPIPRKLTNLTRGLFKEICLNKSRSFSDNHFLERNEIRQFIRTPSGKLLRFYLSVPFISTGSSPLQNYEVKPHQDAVVPCTAPLEPLVGFKPQNVYQIINNHPVTSQQNSHPFVHTVVHHDTDFISRPYSDDKALAKCLLYAYASALGQARLIHGEGFSGDLAQPITVNSISTDGARYTLGSFQLNSLDLNSSKPNLFSYHPQRQDLFEFCGYDNARVSLRGFSSQTYRMLETMLVDQPSTQKEHKISTAN